MLDSCMHLSEVKQILNVTAWKWRFSASAMLVILQVLLVLFISLDAPDLVCSILKTSLCRNSSWALVPLTALSKAAKWPKKVCPSVCFAYCLSKKGGGNSGRFTSPQQERGRRKSLWVLSSLPLLFCGSFWPDHAGSFLQAVLTLMENKLIWGKKKKTHPGEGRKKSLFAQISVLSMKM